MSALRQQIVELRLQGHRPADIARRLDRTYATVRHHLRFARDREGMCFPPIASADAREHIKRMLGTGALVRQGALLDVIETLTPGQVDTLLEHAPRAMTFAEALGVFLAQHLPEKELHD